MIPSKELQAAQRMDPCVSSPAIALPFNACGAFQQFHLGPENDIAVFVGCTVDMPFRETGLERSAPLEKDIAWFKSEYGLEAQPVGEAGTEYAAYLKNLAETNPPAFICHFYNIYFAHTAGGLMIGMCKRNPTLPSSLGG